MTQIVRTPVDFTSLPPCHLWERPPYQRIEGVQRRIKKAPKKDFALYIPQVSKRARLVCLLVSWPSCTLLPWSTIVMTVKSALRQLRVWVWVSGDSIYVEGSMVADMWFVSAGRVQGDGDRGATAEED